jgi:pyrroline-5-carboxylate reductase
MKVCILGCGKMGGAVLEGWLTATSGACAGIEADACTIVSAHQSSHAALRKRFGQDVAIVESVLDAPAFDMVVIGVKPQVFGSVLPELARAIEANAQVTPSPLVVSIAAGITLEAIEAALPAAARVVRVMPNTPLQVGAGASVVAAGAGATQADAQFVCELFAALGMADIVPEAQIDAVCALSGGGPAYVAALMEALERAGVESGLDAGLAAALVRQTVIGTCKLMDKTGQSAEATRVAVCSPGGTTLAALDAMENAGFSNSISAGIIAAQTRAKELAQ